MTSRLADRVVDIVQVLTGVALLIGLVLVVWELRQTRSISVAQLTSDGYGLAMQLTIAGLGEAPHETYAKLCSHPEKMTPEDYQVLDSYYRVLIQQAARTYIIAVRTGFYSETWKVVATGSIRSIVSTVAGRVWWQKFGSELSPEFQEIGRQQLASVQPTKHICVLNDWQAEVLMNLKETRNDQEPTPSAGVTMVLERGE